MAPDQKATDGADEDHASVARWQDVRSRIARVAAECGRAAEDVTLVAVSKTYPGQVIEPLLNAGVRVFGENRVQEAALKWSSLKDRYSGIELHLIGPLQTNKVKEAIALFDVIETVDRPRLADALAKEIGRSPRQPRVFVEINIGAEPQKAGVLPEEADAFIDYCRNLGLSIEGLMCIPPAGQQAAPHFALLAEIARRNGIQKLSMGMSADYELAIELGATHVRVGTAIFGARTPVTE